jgi:hypothetical protein
VLLTLGRDPSEGRSKSRAKIVRFPRGALPLLGKGEDVKRSKPFFRPSSMARRSIYSLDGDGSPPSNLTPAPSPASAPSHPDTAITYSKSIESSPV